MSKYAKAWGALLGAIVGVLGVHGLVPAGLDANLTTAIDVIVPIATSTLGTILAPKNKY